MATIRDNCPICGGQLMLVQVECQQCHTHFESPAATLAEPSGANEPPHLGALAKLSRDQLAFVETFIRARGIIKVVESMLGISYPTVRSRLDDVVATMGLSPDDDRPGGEARRSQRKILDDLADGRISVQEAHALLRRIAR